MNVYCSTNPCPILLNAACVFYQGADLIYTGVNTNDNLQTALEKIDARFSSVIATLNVTSPLQKTGTVNVVLSIPQATSLVDGYLDSSDWSVFNSKQNPIALTTIGSSGPSTFNGLSGALNIPDYSSALSGFVPTSRTLTINGVTYDLSANRTWNVGTVTSITFSGPLTGGTITGSGTVGITQSSASVDGYLSSTDWSIFNSKIGGTGAAGQVAYWNGASTQTGSNNLFWDSANNRLGIGTVIPTAPLDFGDATGSAGSISKIALYASVYGNYGFGVSPNQLDYVSANSHVFYNNSPSLVELLRIDGSGNITSLSLIGTGTRMVVASSTGVLSTQAIPTGTVTSITASTGITGGTITTSGTIAFDTTWGDARYQLVGSYVPTSRTLTINGTSYDLSADRSWTIATGTGTVTSIATTGPITGGTITTSGTIGITQATISTNGYLSSTDWNIFNGKQPQLNGTGFVKASGTTISYDNSTYYLASNPNAYIPLTALSGGTGINYNNLTGVITNTAPNQIVSLANGTAISVTGTYPNFTITNTAPDQVVSLTQGGTTVITGTYPNFTISSNDAYVGTVTSIATSGPITGGTITTSGTIGITQSTTSTDGYLSSIDWNIFNNKIAASYTYYIGTTLNALNRASAAQTLTGISIDGNAGTAGLVNVDNAVVYGRSGLQFAQSPGPAGNDPAIHQTPTGDWWHVLRMNHANVAGYYADLAVSMTTNLGLSRRVISNGAQLSNWVTILDALNYNSYSPTLTGTGASGTWGINITGNATTATTAVALVSMNISQFTNDSGYTTNTGTVTSVATSGTVSGLTLTGGTITTSGTITLGGTLSLTSGNVTTALGFTPYSNTNPSGFLNYNIYTSDGVLAGDRYINANANNLWIDNVDTLRVTTGTASVNQVALFESTEPNINIKAIGASNSASLFLSPSAGFYGAIHNRTGGGLEFYTGASPAVAMTIGANLNVGIGGAPNAINSLEVSRPNQWSGAFIGNMGGPRNPSTNYGLHIGWNYSTSGESNILWGTGEGLYPYLKFSTWDGSTKTDRVEFQNTGNVVFKQYTSVLSFPGTIGALVGYLGFDSSGNILTVAAPTGAGTVTSVATSGPITGGTITTSGTIGITQSGISTDGYLSSTDWNTFNNKVPTSRTLTINGTTYDLSADRSWTIPSISDGDKGDITVSGSGSVWTIDNAVVGVAKLSATGTPSSSTFLRGDNTWATIGGGTVVSNSYTPTLTNIFNCTSLSVDTATYTRIDNIVTVSVGVSLIVSSLTAKTEFYISLPITSSVASQLSCGTGTFCDEGSVTSSVLVGMAHVDKAYTTCKATSTSSSYMNVVFQYTL